MQTFFFPIQWWIPEFDADVCGDAIRVHKRKWDVSIFDLYSLIAQNHPTRLPAELLHIFLQNVNLEIEIPASSVEQAIDKMDCYRAMLYLRGTSPTVAPFGCNMSLNAYAGINDRSSDRQAVMHEGLREGITHKTARVEIWPHQLSFACIQGAPGEFVRKVGSGVVTGATEDLERWLEYERKTPVLRAARRALVQAPLMPDLSSSILHCWQGIESLFPSISTEITFRTSLLLAELLEPLRPRQETYDTSKKSYGDRSKIAHGSQHQFGIEKWSRAWVLLRDAIQAILINRGLPSEEELTRNLLER
ncbi:MULTISPECIES: HEPN domain-containing protein [Rhizobium/Agrobacterium group]|uniref:HEPN domain-containing protein n=1 Tax=Rhizobium/Agrobacterium group TaxID=227290 RepID=UPI00157352D9|nr:MULTISPECIES: HEPN domain-containing protein [Rhizobium/Agrobacterium group]NSX95918.1 hypothetical protein [Agrobacterium vitis]NSZ27057.1 hypothetical protein [Agrobacterium vitis]UJL77074.1 hypothetical protein AVCG678_05855 [Agrobacterium vitis]UJL82284.1 hypothetical protein AVCG78_05850 [Agrobacterium vitis]